MSRKEFMIEHGEDFVDNFDEAFEIEQEYVPTLRERLLAILSSRYAFYIAGFIDGILVLAAIKYLLGL